MRNLYLLLVLLFGLATPVVAQNPDTTAARTDSAASARADSMQLADDLAELFAGGGESDPAVVSRGPVNPRLLPDITVVGDLVADLSPEGSTQEDGARLSVREVEVALQSVVDPYFRGSVFLGFSDAEGVAVEQAMLTTTALPYGIQATLGRFLMPVTKLNNSHRHALHTLNFPHVIEQFLGEEGLKGTGVEISRIFAPFGFYQEVLVTAVDGIGEAPEDLVTAEPANRRLDGLGYSARLRNYWDLSENANFELSGSVLTGVEPRALSAASGEINAANARRTLLGGDFTFRWRPLREALYKSFLFRAEYLYQLGDEDERFMDPLRDRAGAYVFGRYQITRRLFLGSRYDWVGSATSGADDLRAGSAYLEFYPSEFSKLLATFERLSPGDADALNRIVLQATFALGPHSPHPF